MTDLTPFQEQEMALIAKLVIACVEGSRELVGEDSDAVYEQAAHILLRIVMGMPNPYRNSLIYTISQVWTLEVEHNPKLRAEVLKSISRTTKETMQ